MAAAACTVAALAFLWVLPAASAGDPAARVEQARELIGQGQLAKARKLLEQVVRDDPGFAPGLVELSKLANHHGDHAEAVELANRASGAASTDEERLVALAEQTFGLAHGGPDAVSAARQRLAEATEPLREQPPGMSLTQARIRICRTKELLPIA